MVKGARCFDIKRSIPEDYTLINVQVSVCGAYVKSMQDVIPIEVHRVVNCNALLYSLPHTCIFFTYANMRPVANHALQIHICQAKHHIIPVVSAGSIYSNTTKNK